MRLGVQVHLEPLDNCSTGGVPYWPSPSPRVAGLCACREQDLEETEDLYDQVYIEDHDEIYDDLCSVRKRRSHTVCSVVSRDALSQHLAQRS